MADTTRGWAIAMAVVGLLAILTGLAADGDASVVVGGFVLAFGLFSLARSVL